MGSGERCRQGWTDCSGCLVLTPGAEEAETGKILSVLKHMLHSKKTKTKKNPTQYSVSTPPHFILTLLVLAGVGCVRRGGAVVVADEGSGG